MAPRTWESSRCHVPGAGASHGVGAITDLPSREDASCHHRSLRLRRLRTRTQRSSRARPGRVSQRPSGEETPGEGSYMSVGTLAGYMRLVPFRSLLILVAVVSIAVAGCGSNGRTAESPSTW